MFWCFSFILSGWDGGDKVSNPPMQCIRVPSQSVLNFSIVWKDFSNAHLYGTDRWFCSNFRNLATLLYLPLYVVRTYSDAIIIVFLAKTCVRKSERTCQEKLWHPMGRLELFLCETVGSVTLFVCAVHLPPNIEVRSYMNDMLCAPIVIVENYRSIWILNCLAKVIDNSFLYLSMPSQSINLLSNTAANSNPTS